MRTFWHPFSLVFKNLAYRIFQNRYRIFKNGDFRNRASQLTAIAVAAAKVMELAFCGFFF
jgi:hypothetical protein